MSLFRRHWFPARNRFAKGFFHEISESQAADSRHPEISDWHGARACHPSECVEFLRRSVPAYCSV
jgi:hypothetical protein